MTSLNLSPVDWLVMLLFAAGILLSLLRLLKGPFTPDRIVAADTLSVIGTAGLVLLSFWLDSVLYLDVALIYAVLAFVGIIALARIIEGGAS